jgi:phosphatidylserine/phosphatidylglycerophosphate/cardiolipin synthase-like enzyme
VHALFSPRHALDPLSWYAERLGGATVMAGITAPFGLSTPFEDALRNSVGDALHYLILDKRDNNQDQWSADPKVLVAVGSSGGVEELSRWANEQLSGFNTYVRYLHTKILLLDPLGADPTVISGSANFSADSTNLNDENMVVIRGDTQVADVYFTEFARIFNHFYARWWASQLSSGPADAHAHSFLAETDVWQKPYFTQGNPKQLQRVLFSSRVEGNA